MSKKPLKEPVEIITTHLNADFDALASMIAAKKLYPEATLVFPGSQEKNLRNFFLQSTLYLFNFAKIKQINFNSIKRLILVDTRQISRIGKFSEIIGREDLEVHIYDHHPESVEDIKGDKEIIRNLGATTSILTGMIREKNISLTPDEATIMSLGIHEDTGSFTFSSTKPEDYMAAAWLTEQGANHNQISDMLTRELSTEQVWLLSEMIKSSTTETFSGIEIVITKVTSESYIGDFAVLVHKFMEMENLDALFAMAQMEEKIYLVCRSRVPDVNAAEIALAFGGGGHPEAASASIKNLTLIQTETALKKELAGRINPQRIASDMMTSPVLSILPEQDLKEAADIMTRYNINVLIVLDKQGKLLGYITRQVVEKAVFFNLGHILVKEYMNIDVLTVGPASPLKDVQDLIIKNKLRVLPVLEQDKVVGVITRTDLLNILVGAPIIPDFLYDSQHASHFTREKNLASLLNERLPERIVKLLKEFGETADKLGYNVYLVGGLIRDVYLKRKNFDVDIVVEGDGINFAQEYAADRDVRVRSHRKFVTAVIIFPDGFKVDVATARMEYYESPGAPPIVESSSLKMDLYRRDFTINTFAIKLNKKDYGALIDYFGAQRDLKEKVVRVLHNLSFVEDPTRVFRAIRFEQRFGFKIGKLTLALMKNAVRINSFKDLSGRRLFIELKLLLKEHEPIKGIERMNEFKLLMFISPKIKLTQEIKELLQQINGVISWFDLLYLDEPYDPWKVYWHGLTSSLNPKDLVEIADRLRMTENEKLKLISQRGDVNSILDKLYRLEKKDNYQLYTLLSQYDTDLLLYLLAKANSEKIKKLISTYFTKIKTNKVLLKGRDLKAMGIKPGPVYKEIFDKILRARLNQSVSTKRNEREFVRSNFQDLIGEQ